MSEEVSWKTALTEAANDSWSQGNMALLLSRVPGFLKAKGIDVGDVLKGEKLRFVLQRDAADVLELVKSDDDNLVWGIVPVGSTLETPNTRHFRRIENAKGQIATARYFPAVWKAFLLPLSGGKKRYLSTQAPFWYRDIPEGDPSPSNTTEVAAKFVVESSLAGPDRTERTLENIKNWLQSHQLDKENFTIRRREDSGVTKMMTTHQQSLLGQLFETLTAEDLSRISMPLDIVQRLSAQKKI